MLAFAALLSLAAAIPAQALVNSVSGLTTCQPSLLSWTASTAPYFLSIIPGGQPNGTPLKNLGEFKTETSYTWNVDLAAGTSITIALKDGTGALMYSGETTIAAGSDTSCVNADVGSASGTAPVASGSATASAAATSAAAAAGASSAATSAAAGASSAVTSAAGAASSKAASATGKAAAATSSAAAAVSGAKDSAKSAAASASSAVTNGAFAAYGFSSVAVVAAVGAGFFALA